MTPEQASQIVTDYDGAVKSSRYLEWDVETLSGIRNQLREALQALSQYTIQRKVCEATIEKINERLEAKRAEQKTDTRYAQDQKRQERAERRANLALVISIASFVVSTLFGVFGHLGNIEKRSGNLPSPTPLLSPTPTASGSP